MRWVWWIYIKKNIVYIKENLSLSSNEFFEKIFLNYWLLIKDEYNGNWFALGILSKPQVILFYGGKIEEYGISEKEDEMDGSSTKPYNLVVS